MGKQKQWRREAHKHNLEAGRKHQGRRNKPNQQMSFFLQRAMQEAITASLTNQGQVSTQAMAPEAGEEIVAESKSV